MKKLKWTKGHFISAGQLLCKYSGHDKSGKEIHGTFEITTDDWGNKKKWILYYDNRRVGNFARKSSAKQVAQLIYNG